MALRDRALIAFAATSAATALVAHPVGGLVGAGPGYAPKAAALVLLLGLVAAPALRLHGRPTFGQANAVTLARAGVTGLAAGFLAEPAAAEVPWALVALGTVAFGLDGADGRVARVTGSASPYGARLDLELDALTMVVLSALAWQLERAGAWVLLAGALRYAFVAAALAWPWLARPPFPSPHRRFLCGVAVTLLLVALAPLGALSTGAAALAVLALVGSFGADAVWLVVHRRDPW